MAYA
jgi:hypothetical protein